MSEKSDIHIQPLASLLGAISRMPRDQRMLAIEFVILQIIKYGEAIMLESETEETVQ